MARPFDTPFPDTPRSAAGHFALNIYAAVYQLLFQLKRMGAAGGVPLDDLFEHFPFLGQYFEEFRPNVPEKMTWARGTRWWQEEITRFEDGCEAHLPIRALCDSLELAFPARLAFMLSGLVEEDSRFGTLFAEIQQPLTNRRPTLELIGQLVMDDAISGELDSWGICGPLLANGLLETNNQQVPRSEWLLRVPPALWDAARGHASEERAAWYSHRRAECATPLAGLLVQPELVGQLAQIPHLIDSGTVRILVFRGPQGSPVDEVLGAVARARGQGVLRIDAAALTDEAPRRLLGPLATMLAAMPVIRYDLGPGESVVPPSLCGYRGPIGIGLGIEGGLSSDVTEASLTLNLPFPDAALREQYWKRSARGVAIDDLATISRRVQLPGELIEKVAAGAAAHAALRGAETIATEDVRSAARSLNRQLLDTLAARIEGGGSWDQLIASPMTRDKLSELERRCRHRETLLERLGRGFGGSANRGVRALFTGASGTGKTLAAKILAAELGMDLYRVDLAAVVNKYIGETEKNLHRVLSRAEALDVVLLLDEGDALLGRRTEVRSANDRYANLETNYLLQRLEGYAGIVLVTTNLGDAIDPAFQRRMDVVVSFLPPQAAERLEILQLHLPAGHEIELEVLETVASRCALTGGQLRNAALLAALLALDDGDVPVAYRHLEAAMRSEYRKAGGLFPLDDAAPSRGAVGLEALRAALEAG